MTPAITKAHQDATELIDSLYESLDGNPLVEEFHERHGIDSMLILTVCSSYAAQAEVQKLRSRIEGKTVVEIGAGVGMLAIQMARYAKHVWAIESDPAWNFAFTKCLYAIKPPNLSWFFGRAQDLIGVLKADVAVIYTRSDLKGMGAIASQMAPEVIRGPLLDFNERYGEYMTPEQLVFAEKIATEAILEHGHRRGLPIEQASELEAQFLAKFPGAPTEAR